VLVAQRYVGVLYAFQAHATVPGGGVRCSRSGKIPAPAINGQKVIA
jgi:hypothetical protein